MRRILVFQLCIFVFALAGCGTTGFSSPVTGEATPWTHLNFRNNPADFQFAVMGDRTGGCRLGIFAKACDRLNLLQPEFVICVGDLIEGATADKNVLKTQRDEFDGIVGKLEMPFFYVVGNHDIGNPVMAETWRSRYGREYYYFIYRNVLFLCLCTEDDRPGNISDVQVEYFKNAIQANKDVRWTFLFMHQPLYQAPGGPWQAIEAALGDRPFTVFAGHLHTHAIMKRGNGTYIRMATTGAGSPLQGPMTGTFDHVIWVTMAPEGPRIANIMLNGIFGEDVVAEAALAK